MQLEARGRARRVCVIAVRALDDFEGYGVCLRAHFIKGKQRDKGLFFFFLSVFLSLAKKSAEMGRIDRQCGEQNNHHELNSSRS